MPYFRPFLISTLVLSFTCAVAGSDGIDNPGKDGDSSGEVVSVALSPAEARRQASLLHRTYLATLMVVHREYFDEDARQKLPARAFEEVFSEIDRSTGGKTRRIAVNTPPMNLDHTPKTDFEKEAAKVLASGRPELERIESGMLHRAAPVPFQASCNQCHQSSLGHRRKGRMAALVISLPITQGQRATGDILPSDSMER